MPIATSRERLALVGDAAHVIHPIAGQGLNLGCATWRALAEIAVDARRLGLDIGMRRSAGALRALAALRCVTLAAMTDGLNRLFSNRSRTLAGCAIWAWARSTACPGLKKVMMRHAMGILGDLPKLVRGEQL